jgi:hypothetical protein
VRRLLVVAVVLVVLLVAADFAARAVAATELRDRARQRVQGAQDSSASVGSFPFLARLLLAGSIARVNVKVKPVATARITFDFVNLDLRDVHVDRNRLLRDRSVQLTGLGSGTVTAEVSQGEISRLAHLTVTFSPGRAAVTVGGTQVSAPVDVTRGQLTIGSGRAALHVTIPRGPLMACDATSVVVRQGVIDLSCTVHDVPPELLRTAQRSSSA